MQNFLKRLSLHCHQFDKFVEFGRPIINKWDAIHRKSAHFILYKKSLIKSWTVFISLVPVDNILNFFPLSIIHLIDRVNHRKKSKSITNL